MFLFVFANESATYIFDDEDDYADTLNKLVVYCHDINVDLQQEKGRIIRLLIQGGIIT